MDHLYTQVGDSPAPPFSYLNRTIAEHMIPKQLNCYATDTTQG
jgi:hypothetical protein